MIVSGTTPFLFSISSVKHRSLFKLVFRRSQLAWVGTVADSDGSHHARRASLFHFGIVLSKDVPGPQKGRRASLGLAMKTLGPCARANDTGTSDAYKHDLTSWDVAEESFDYYLEAVAYKEHMLNVGQHNPQRAYAVRSNV